MRKAVSFLSLIPTIVMIAALPVQADWINLSGAQSAANIAEIYVENDHVRLELEVFVNDIDKFIDLLPDEWFEQANIESPPIQERMKRFSTSGFRVITGGQEQLTAQMKLVETRLRSERPNPFAGTTNPYTRQIIPGPPEDKRVLYAELVYPFKSQPREITFVPPLGMGGKSMASIGFIAYHKGVPIVDYRYLSEPAQLTLDWKDPWYSRFENKALQRWQQSGIRTFLYIEPFEVRHETLVRVKDMEAWMDLGLEGNEYIETNEFVRLKDRIGKFLLQHSNVLIDGQSLRPILDRTSFVKYTMTRTFFIDQPERLPLNTAMVGVIVTYLTKEIPQKVTVEWDLFSERIQKVPTNAVDPAGPFPSYVTPDDNLFVWNNFLKTYQVPTVVGVKVDSSLTHVKLPLASIICLIFLIPVLLHINKQRKDSGKFGLSVGVAVLLVAGSILLYPFLKFSVARPAALAPQMSDEKAVEVLKSLLKNVYRSFDFREEEDVYDRLATSVSGDLLTEIYLQNRKSLVVTQAGGAQARVKEVQIEDVKVSPLINRPVGLMFQAKWTALGTVGHWGHIHTRQNQYDAKISAEPVDNVWKITGLELIEEKRIDQAAQTKS
jgi:hypothetical protein